MNEKNLFIINKLQFNGLTCYYDWLISLLKINEGLNPFWFNLVQMGFYLILCCII
ncbi:hypothetical protein lpa_01927 [Legionella pneumophila 2300/99 Alcoy]|nr:hypothetical protein lpa_01927 [Legionella pneumophila 2300/99 Alcoy]